MNDREDLSSAWSTYCDSLKELGTSVLSSPHSLDDVSAAEGMRHLARMVALSLTQQIEFSDPTDPRFFRSNDDVWQWGGPNVDNVYLGCPIHPSGTYRLTGDISGQPGSILQILGTPAPGDPIAVRVDMNLVSVADDSGRVDIVLSGDDTVDAAVRIPADGARLMIREYVPDESSRRAGFVIERIDGQHAPQVLEPQRLATILNSSRQWLGQNIQFWQDYTSRRREEVGVNRIEPPTRGPGMGSESIAYSAGFFELDEDECLLITVDRPRARYWSMQLYSMGWYEALDPTRRQSSLNDTQSHVDDDSLVRFVIAHHDPAVPNWLDCAGHREGMAHLRAVWCDELPNVSAELLKLNDLRRSMPSSHPITSMGERNASLRSRRMLAQSKFVR